MPIGPAPLVIGRDASCDLALNDTKISRRHASVEISGDGQVLLRDLESTNGVFVGGNRITGSITLVPGQSFRVGDTVVAVETDQPAPASATQVVPPTAAIRPLPGAGLGAGPPPGPRPPSPPPVSPGRPPVAASRPAPPPGVGTTTIRRMMLERSVRRTSILAGLLAVVVVVLVVLLATGVLPPSDDSGEGGSVEATVKAVAPSTVLVSTALGDEPIGSGSGWVLDAKKGLIVTNHHVIATGTKWTVGVAGEDREARLMGTANCEDLAVLRVSDTAGLKTLPLGSQSDLQQGQSVVALGFPSNLSERNDLTTTRGVVSVIKTRARGGDAIDAEDLPNVIRTDTPINPGNSGGPLVTLENELVGVNTLGLSRNDNEAYAIGVDRVKQIVPDLAEGNSQNWTGFAVVPAATFDEEFFAEVGLPERNGFVVLGAAPGTPAANSQLARSKGLIVAINGEIQDGRTNTYCDSVRGTSRAQIQYYAPGSSRLRSEIVRFEP